MNVAIINNQLEIIGNVLRGIKYDGFEFYNYLRLSDRDSFQFTFIGNKEDTVNKYFLLEIPHSELVMKELTEVVEFIDSKVRNHPDLKKASHHQEFYKKFDEMINE